MPIWDDLLSDKDQKAFDKANMGRETISIGERPALLIIDMSYGFVDSEYRLGSSEAGYPTVNNIKELIPFVRQKGFPIIYTTGFSEEYEAGNGRWKGGVPKVEREIEIVADLKPEPEDIVLQKRRPSGFFGTNLVDMLIYHQVDSLIVTGMSTSGCVRATVVDAFSYNYKVLVPQECVGDRSSLSHKVSLLDIHMKYGDVISLEHLKNKLL
ncbi:isochorismatase family protein [Halalkalibacterium ligniniphilum]|uniref:isochorismatase family protein n=1 Tax=Halalkalibacterium ligniniphilum TaxID=1134413 RepID=UPI00034CABDE|nr:isochorismatase family protein [Halalkalibacterium ligniniphilum]